MRKGSKMQNNDLKADLETALAVFTGSELYYRHSIGNFVYTDGVKYLAEHARCYWLLDMIGSCQHLNKVKDVPFQLWELAVYEDQTALVTMKEDSDTPVIVKQKLPYTDFPLAHIKLYLTDGVVMLPSEY